MSPSVFSILSAAATLFVHDPCLLINTGSRSGNRRFFTCCDIFSSPRKKERDGKTLQSDLS